MSFITNADAERSVLGAILSDAEVCADLAREILPRSDAMGDIRHRVIYSAILSLLDAGDPVDIISVRARLEALPVGGGRVANRLEEAGGQHYLTELCLGSPSPYGLEHHAKIVADMAKKRRIAAVASRILQDAQSPGSTGDEMLGALQEATAEIEDYGAPPDTVLLGDMVQRAMNDLQNRKPGVVSGFRTYWNRLDQMLGGLQPGRFAVIAGRPSMGKTAWSLALARQFADRGGIPTGFISLESGEDEIATRFLASLSGENTQAIRSRMMSSARVDAALEAGARAHKIPIYLDFRSGLTVGDIRAVARRWQRNYGVEILFIDYLQFIQRVQGRSQNDQSAWADVSRGLKRMAKDLKILVVALSQLNRQVEGRGGGFVPRLSDLRETGAIEQDIDLALFLHRPGYYSDEIPKTTTYVLIEKHRDGPTGKIEMYYDLPTGQFNEVDNATPPEPRRDITEPRRSTDDDWRDGELF